MLLAATLVGPQLLLFYAVVPSTWLIDDEGLRRRVTLVVTRRFATMTVVAVVGLVVTGLYQFYNEAIVPQPVQDSMLDYRWGVIFMTKMTLLVVLVALIAVHGAVFGRRVREASEAVERGEAETAALERARKGSFLFSTLLLVVSIALLLLGATLGHHPYSLQPS
ncbi:MAG: hypothetical protein FJ035_01855 [Chloroflexi bacterium]|nr:hypothetical protein [Chloroflexota bacterium]